MIDIKGNDLRITAIEEIKLLNLPIFIWGGGTYCEYIIKYLRSNNITAEIGIVVDDVYYNNEDGAMPFSQYLENWAEKSVLIFGFFNYKIVKNKYKQYKDRIKYLYDFRINCVRDRLLLWNKNEIESELPAYEKTFAMLADDKSKRTMELFLRAAVNGEFDKLWEDCYEDAAYYNSIIANLHIKILVDCGAFDGDDICNFVKVFPQYDMIFAIEPDEENVGKLRTMAYNDGINNVIVIDKGVYKETTVLHFSSGEGVASHLSDEGDALVSVVALDEILEEYFGNILIKMDIEGSEMDALIGASNTIAKKHPCLVICVYHKEDDLIKIPQYIASLVEPDTYDYYLRFHGFSLSELVFYAVPRDVVD